MKRPTIGEIARRAGVSHAAVSYALNDQPGVSAITRGRILTVAQELGWEANTAARALVGASADAIGLVVSRPDGIPAPDPSVMSIICGLEQVLGEHSTALVLHVVTDMPAQLATYRRWWNGRRVDGVVVVDLGTDDPRAALLKELAMPAVAIAHGDWGGPLPMVANDESGAVRAVLHLLTELGHRRIARVSGPLWLSRLAERTRSMAELAAELGLPAPVLVTTDSSGDQPAVAIRALLASADRPTAVICDNDVMAVAALGVCQQLDLAVPADISVLAWEDSPLCAVTYPSLTALSRDVAMHGAVAAEVLLQHIAGTPVGSVWVPAAQLIQRGSTGAAPQETSGK